MARKETKKSLQKKWEEAANYLTSIIISLDRCKQGSKLYNARMAEAERFENEVRQPLLAQIEKAGFTLPF